jgi:hypothetical protein
MSQDIYTEPNHSLFRVASPSIESILVRITIANTLNSPSSIQHSIIEAGKNSLVGGSTFKKEVTAALYKIQSIRFILRKFLLRWLFKRLTCSTTEDIYTLEAIQEPSHVVVWKSRHMYSFEVKTLHKAVTQSLLHTCGMFSMPLRPKNPLTNISLTIGQLISIWNSFTQGSFTISSVVSQYRSVQYNHQRFIEEYATVLSIYSMKRCLMNPVDIEGGEYLLDFIETAYEYNGLILKQYFRNKINNAIVTHKDNTFISKFRIKCIEYNYILLIKKNHTANELLQELHSVYRACLPIIKEHKCELKGNL